VLNHNVETVPRLYHIVRPQASFARSLEVLHRAARHAGGAVVKSGMMVGLGERPQEVIETMRALRGAGCTIVTIGQYLQPSADQLPVASFVTPEQFRAYESEGRRMGIAEVVAGPFVRSSYRAHETSASQRLRPQGRRGDTHHESASASIVKEGGV
jgi:lipoic acid synthetase